MADPYYKKTPYGWCCDHSLEKTKYRTVTWEEYVNMMEDWLNAHECNYSVVHYKWIVRVHVYFSSIKKMGFKAAVELHELSDTKWDHMALLGRPGPTHEDHVKAVRDYFILNDLPIEE